MSTDAQLQTVLTDLAAVLDGIDESRDHDPTPCTAWDVTALRGHVIGWLTAFTDGYSAADGVCSDPESVQVDGRGGDQVRALAGRLAEALPEATTRPLKIGGDGMPGDMALSMILWEYQMHGWDLARATGQAWEPAADGVEASLGFADGMLSPDTQGEGKMFASPVEVGGDAAPFDRLLGKAGRDPRWTA